jgi:hypothetical protein
MARQLHQLASVQEAFAARIAQKVAEQREKVQDRAEDVPLFGWLLKSIAGLEWPALPDHATISTLFMHLYRAPKIARALIFKGCGEVAGEHNNVSCLRRHFGVWRCI